MRGPTTRVVLFDAFSSNIRDSASNEVPGGYEGGIDTTPRLWDHIEYDARGTYYRPRSEQLERVTVQADHQDPRCAEIRGLSRESLEEYIFQHTPIKEVPRAPRPQGEHVIPSKTTTPKPQKRVPYRPCGIREAAVQ